MYVKESEREREQEGEEDESLFMSSCVFVFLCVQCQLVERSKKGRLLSNPVRTALHNVYAGLVFPAE